MARDLEVCSEFERASPGTLARGMAVQACTGLREAALRSEAV